MALTENDRELLAVVKYFNEQKAKKKIARLLVKLRKEFGIAVTSQLTGFTEGEITRLSGEKFVKPKPSRQVKKLLVESKKNVAELDEPDTFQGVNEMPETAPEEVKPVITLDEDSPLHERIAYEMSMQIGAAFKTGDQFYTTKQAMEVFECGAETARGALKILKDKGIIDYANGNFRNGYVVK